MGDDMAIIKASVLQAGTVALDTDATLAKAEAMIAEAGGIGARIAVLPEGFVGGYPKGADFHIYLGARTPEGRDEFRRYFETAIPVPGPETERLGRAARHANLFLTAGVIEREGGTLYCTALFFGPDDQKRKAAQVTRKRNDEVTHRRKEEAPTFSSGSSGYGFAAEPRRFYQYPPLFFGR